MKPFKATHKIVDETGVLAWDESDALVMQYGNTYPDRQVWEEGGHYDTEAEILARGYTLLPL